MPENRTIRPRRHIKQKIRPGGPAPEAAILNALNAAEDLIGQYQGWAIDDLENLWQAFMAAASDGRADAKRLSELYDIAHETRGQGGSFGFPLISVLGDSLCKYLDGRTSVTDQDLDVVRIHILAMKATFRQGLKGAQGNLAKELAPLLKAFRERVDPNQAQIQMRRGNETRP